ncbi:MAG: guanylate kinase [Pseudomonadota bacterium]|nr:guanylate kinase [Pseudomonadota bacterium]
METDKIFRRGLLFVLSSPSGAGKSTISKALLKKSNNLTMSVSVTTRPMRSGEVDGRDYHFIDDGTFKTKVKNSEFLEHATVFENSYGTLKKPVEDLLSAGCDVLFDVDWQGTQQLAESASNDLVTVFILPPSIKELERRLQKRAQDSNEVVSQRMSKATSEMSHWREYDYIIVNEDIDSSIENVIAILTAERLKRDRQVGLGKFIRKMGYA